MRTNITWIKAILVMAGIFNIGWGVITIFFQPFYFNLIEMKGNHLTSIWISSGIMAMVMGIGYLIASTNAFRYWPIVLMGMLIKIFMPVSILVGHELGEVSSEVFRVALTNHLIWWLPFGAILYRVYRQPYMDDSDMIHFAAEDWESSLEMYHTSKNRTIIEASRDQPVMLVFLRHFGCTFCRESLFMISEQIKDIESMGTSVMLVHMVSEDDAGEQLEQFGLEHLEHVSDPESLLYKAFRLRRGNLWQLFGPKILWRGLYAGFIRKHGLGDIAGDPFQMPGIFLIYDGKIRKQFFHHTAADVPPYLELADCSACYD
jgi:peroxiredoxin